MYYVSHCEPAYGSNGVISKRDNETRPRTEVPPVNHVCSPNSLWDLLRYSRLSQLVSLEVRIHLRDSGADCIPSKQLGRRAPRSREPLNGAKLKITTIIMSHHSLHVLRGRDNIDRSRAFNIAIAISGD